MDCTNTVLPLSGGPIRMMIGGRVADGAAGLGGLRVNQRREQQQRNQTSTLNIRSSGDDL